MNGRSRWLFRASFVLVFVLPTVALMIVSVSHYREESTRSVMKAKELQGILAVAIVTEKLTAQFNLGTSFAIRPLLIRNIEQGRWQDAMHVLDGVLEHYEDIDRIVLFDPAGVVKADLPAAGVVGQSRADKEWYREFSKRRQPYLSGVYLRVAEPRGYVVSLVLPAGITAVGPSTVSVTVHFTPVTASQTFTAGIVLSGARDDRIYSLSVDQVLVTLGGSPAALAGIDGQTFSVTVDVDGLAPGVHVLTPTVNLPASLTLIGLSPQTVSVTVTIAPATPPPSAPPSVGP